MPFDERDLYTGLAALHWSAISETDPRWDALGDLLKDKDKDKDDT